MKQVRTPIKISFGISVDEFNNEVSTMIADIKKEHPEVNTSDIMIFRNDETGELELLYRIDCTEDENKSIEEKKNALLEEVRKEVTFADETEC